MNIYQLLNGNLKKGNYGKETLKNDISEKDKFEDCDSGNETSENKQFWTGKS